MSVNQVLKKPIYLSILIISTFCLTEVALRITGKYSTYSERNGESYTTYWGQKLNSWYLLSEPNKKSTKEKREFTYTKNTNSLGHRELEPEGLFNNTDYKIVFLGDSYTEGMGATYDSTVVRHLETLLNENCPLKYSIYNAGTSGSDPFFYYTLLRDRLISLNPELVIIAINQSDYTDVIFRGGFERFNADSSTTFLPAPKIELFYHYSHFFRAIIDLLGYRGEFFLKVEELINRHESINHQFLELAEKFHELSEKNDFKLLFLLHSGRIEGLGNNRNYFEKLILNQLQSDLSKSPTEFNVINNYTFMDSIINGNNLKNYGYLIDGHYNGKGYQLMAKNIFHNIRNTSLEICN